VAAYYVFAFGVSWSSVAAVLAASGGLSDVRAQDNPLFPLALVGMLAGPSASSLVLTAWLDGRNGLRELRHRLRPTRLPAAWYALALLSAPIASLIVIGLLRGLSPGMAPAIAAADGQAATLLFGAGVALLAGTAEELGWTGFVTPRLRRRHGVLTTGAIVGLLWSAWHVPVVAWGMGGRNGEIPLPLFIAIDALGGLPAFRVLMVWVYERSENVTLAVLMHASLTASTLILAPAVTGQALLIYGVVSAALYWAMFAALAVRWSGGAAARANP
jgi:membrane protease YdiL (CAAX protease family)